MVGSGNLLTREFIERSGKPFDDPATVGEHDGRAVRSDQVEDRRIHRRPDRPGGPALVICRVGCGHVLDRHHDLDVERSIPRCVDDLNRTCRPAIGGGGATAEELADPFERTLGGTEADALWWLCRDLLESFETQAEM